MATRTLSDVLPPRYTSVEVVARGGMGEVYSACDEALGRTVAVKVLAEHHARDPALRERFTREALAAARLSGDPHTVTIFDVGEWNERPYIVMEYVGGGTIGDHLGAGRPGSGEALRWLEQAAAALDAAHAPASSTATSSRRTCCSRRTATSAWPTSGSRARPASPR